MIQSSVNLDNFQEVENGAINSPRSLEACLRQGIDPVNLRARPLEHFMDERGGPKQVAMLKHEHFEKKRKDRLKIVRRERNMIIEYLSQLNPEGGESENGSSPRSPGAAATSMGDKASPGGIHMRDDGASAMLQREAARLEKIRQRQALEIKQMMDFEMKTAKRVQDNLVRQRKQAEHEQMMKQRLEEQRRLAAEKKAAIEAEKLQREEEEKKQRAAMAKLAHAQEQKRKVEAEKQERARVLELRQRELDRQRKQEEFRRNTEAILKKQEDDNYGKMLKMQHDDELRAKKRKEQKERLGKAKARQQAKTQRRIQAALAANEAKFAKRREDFEAKQAELALKNRNKAERGNAAAEKKRLKDQQREQRRRQILDDARMGEEERKQQLMQRYNSHANRQKQIAEKRGLEYELKKCRENLKKQDKLDNIERMRRIDEFVRLQTLQKIESDDNRTQYLNEQKEKMLSERKAAAGVARMRKFRLNQTMEKIRSSKKWENVNMDTILSPSKKSVGGKGRRRRKQMRGSVSLPNLEAP